MADTKFSLIVRHPEKGLTRQDLEGDKVSIGRGPDNDIQILIAEVSVSHAEIVLGGEEVQISDSGSTNGTVVNGTKIGTDPIDLRPMSKVVFGTAVESYLVPSPVLESTPMEEVAKSIDDEAPEPSTAPIAVVAAADADEGGGPAVPAQPAPAGPAKPAVAVPAKPAAAAPAKPAAAVPATPAAAAPARPAAVAPATPASPGAQTVKLSQVKPPAKPGGPAAPAAPKLPTPAAPGAAAPGAAAPGAAAPGAAPAAPGGVKPPSPVPLKRPGQPGAAPGGPAAPKAPPLPAPKKPPRPDQ